MERPPVDDSGPPRRPSGETLVLHVEDNPVFAHLTTVTLAEVDESLHVLSESNAADGLARLAECEVDCVVSDYQLPETDGIEFLEVVRERHPDLPFILFTGRGSEEVASRAISAGVTDYLQKSDGLEVFEVLARQIENAVERRRAVQRFKTFLASAPDSVVVVDAEGTIEEVNQQTEALFGYEREGLVGRPVEVLLPERFREEHVTHRERYVEAPETRPMGADLQLYGLHADGTEFPVDVAISPVYLGGRLEVMAAIRDMSTRQWRETQLEEHAAALERQSARLEETKAVESELREALEAAREELTEARDEGDAHLGAVERNLDRMERLSGELSRLAGEDRTTPDLRPVSLGGAVSRAWADVRVPGASLTDETDDSRLLADEDRLEQLLVNLFLGAVDRGGPAVGVCVEPLDDGFAVVDDGPDLPPEVRAEVPERGDFGLVTIKRIVAAHDWAVTLSDGSEGVRVEIRGVRRP